MKAKTILIFTAVAILCVSVPFAVAGTIMRFEHVALEKGERIVSMEVWFEGVEVISIVNIPRDWDIHLHLESQFKPRISGGCGHGASALISTEELPIFDVKPVASSEKQTVGDATLYVVKDFESGKGREVKIKIKANRP
jgi:hypothetical protein